MPIAMSAYPDHWKYTLSETHTAPSHAASAVSLDSGSAKIVLAGDASDRATSPTFTTAMITRRMP